MTPRRRIPLIDADHGQTLAEYSLLIGLIAVVVALALPGVASGVQGLFSSAAAAF
jgi:Flp pilus assembly pilin Flp